MSTTYPLHERLKVWQQRIHTSTAQSATVMASRQCIILILRHGSDGTWRLYALKHTHGEMHRQKLLGIKSLPSMVCVGPSSGVFLIGIRLAWPLSMQCIVYSRALSTIIAVEYCE